MSMDLVDKIQFKDWKWIYALRDEAADKVVNYYVCDAPVWSERYMRDLVSNLRYGVPSEFSMHLIGGISGETIVTGELLYNAADSVGAKRFLSGGDYIEMENNVQRDV